MVSKHKWNKTEVDIKKVLIWIAVLHYFNSFDKKLPVKAYIFHKAASVALQKMHTFVVDILIIRGMIRRTANLKNTSGKMLLIEGSTIH